MHTMLMGGESAHTWFAAPAAFIGMWVVMMGPMMLPALLPALWRYRQAAAMRGVRRGLATTFVGGGYFFVWIVVGAAAFPLSAMLTELGPIASTAIVAIAGAWQLTSWKAHHLACCRQTAARSVVPSSDAYAAWRHGMRLGLECVRSCGNLMVIPLVFGMMDVRTMVLVGGAISLERLAPVGERMACAAGVIAVATGLLLHA